jgi:uncharacterized membrane protein
MLNPVSCFVWIAGLFYLLFSSAAKRVRFLAYTYLVFLAVMMFLHGKDYYLATIYPMLFAAGSVFWESLIASYTPLRFLRRAIPATVIAAGMIAAPLAIPILPPDRIPAYMAALAFCRSIRLARDGRQGRGSL